MKKIYLLILSLLLTFISYGQLTVIVPHVTASPGQTINIPVKLVGASSTGHPIDACEIYVQFNNTILTYVNLVNFYSGMPQGQWILGAGFGVNGIVSPNWAEPSFGTVAVPDSTTLFEMQFVYNGGSDSLLILDNTQHQTIFLGADFEIITPQYRIDGFVNSNQVTPGLSGPTSVCQGSTGNVYTTDASQSGYTWTVTGGTITSGGGSTDNTATVTWNTTGAESVAVSYTGSSVATLPVTVNASAAVSVSIVASDNPVCTGTSVTYTATPVNGGSTPVYQWKVGATNVGTNSPAFSYTPLNGDVVTCVLTSNVDCPSGNPATSNAITMSVTARATVTCSINVSANPVFSGTSVTFTATPVNGGTTPSFQWKVNGANMGTNSNTFTYIPANGDNVFCIVTSNLPCSTILANSNIIVMTVNIHPLRVVMPTNIVATAGQTINIPVKLIGATTTGTPITSANLQIQYNQAVLTFVDLVNFYPRTPLADWIYSGAGGTVAGNWIDPTLDTIAMPDSTTLFQMRFTYNGDSTTLPFLLTEFTDISFNQAPTTHLNGFIMQNATLTGPTSVCQDVPGNVYTTETGKTNYAWTVTGGTITSGGGSSDNTVTVTWTSAGPGSVAVSFVGSTVTILPVTITPSVTVSVSIVASDNPVCTGTSVTYTATPVNAGVNPVYQWKQNGNNVGTNSSTYSYIPINGDVITCVVTSAAPCAPPATSNAITMSVTARATVTCSINVSANQVFSGTSVTFTATPVNGGTTPSFQWKVNGANMGTNSNTFTYIPANGDNVFCIVTSNLPCSTILANSNIIVMTVNIHPLRVVMPTNIVATAGQTINIPVKLIGATTTGTPITSANLQIQYNQAVLTFVDLVNFYPRTPLADWIYSGAGGTVAGNWIDPTLDTIAMPDSTTLFQMRFTYNGDSTTLPFMLTEFTDISFNQAPTTHLNGFIMQNAALTGPTSVCQDVPGNVYTTETGKTNYAWTVTGGTITSGGGSSDNTVTVTWTSAGPGSVAVSFVGSTVTILPVTITPSVTVSVSIVASDNPVCTGTSVTYTATPVNAGVNPVYQWKQNGNNVGTNSSTYSYIPINGDVITCVVTSAAPCAPPATSNAITMSVTARATVTCSINASANPVFSGTSVTFTATPVNGGTTPSFQWKVNGANMGTNSNTFTYIPANGDNVFCIVTSNLPCSTILANSNIIVMTVNIHPLRVVMPTNIVATAGQTINIPVKLIGATTTGTPITSANLQIQYNQAVLTFVDLVNFYPRTPLADWIYSGAGGTVAGNWIDPTLDTIAMPDSTTLFQMRFTYNGDSTALPFLLTEFTDISFNQAPTTHLNGFIMQNATLTGPTSVCQDVPGNVYTTETGKTNYAWTVTGGTISSGGGSSDNTVTVTWTSAGPGSVAVSFVGSAVTILPVTITPSVTVSVSIVASDNPVCTGALVTYTATPVNAGVNPVYQWKQNGNNVGTNSSTYSYIPINGDLITCVVTSAAPCAPPATSNAITMSVTARATVTCSINASANPVFSGTSVTFTATPVNGGTTPSFQWKVNGVNMGTNSNTFTYTPANGDNVFCIVTSNLPCSTILANSNIIVMTVNIHPLRVVMPTNIVATAGQTINIPVKLIGATTAGTPITSANLQIHYNQAVLTFVDLVNFYPRTPLADWIYSGAGGTVAGNWIDPTLDTIAMPDSTTLFQMRFTYTGDSTTLPFLLTEFTDISFNQAPTTHLNGFIMQNATLTGPTSVCQGLTGNVYTTDAGQTNYVWTVTGGIITSGGGTSDNTVTVTWPVSGSQSVAVSYSGSVVTTLPVLVSAQFVATATNNSLTGQMCPGNLLTLSALPTGMNYYWTAPDGTHPTTNPVTRTASISDTGHWMVQVSDGNGCSASASTYVFVGGPLTYIGTAGNPTITTCSTEMGSCTPSGTKYIEIPVTVVHFKKIVAVSLELQFDPALLQFKCAVSPLGWAGGVMTSVVGSNLFISAIAPVVPDVVTFDLDDNSTLFTLRFQYVGTMPPPEGDLSTSLHWVDNMLENVYAAADPEGVQYGIELCNNPIPGYFFDGGLTIKAPVIACPSDMLNVPAEPGVCDAHVYAGWPSISVCMADTMVSFVRSDSKTNILDPYDAGTWTVTWKVTNASGFWTDCVQNISVVDNQAPQITTCPANYSIEGCSTAAITDLAFSETAVPITATQFTGIGGVAFDNCAITAYSYQDTKSGACTITVHRTFTVTDAANHTTTCTQTITVHDQTPPALTGTPYAGTTGTNACKASAATAAPFSATNAAQGYTDLCGSPVTVTLMNTNVTGTNCAWTVTYTFNVADSCGNALTGQTYSNTGSDQTAPIFSSCPSNANKTDDCFNTYYTVSGTEFDPEASDACSGTVTYSWQLSGASTGSGTGSLAGTHLSSTGTGVTTVTWTATDACGNANSTCTFTVTVSAAARYNITGNMNYYNPGVLGPYTPMTNVALELQRMYDQTVYGTSTTSGSGSYHFDNQCPQTDYIIVVTNNNKPAGGINSTDAAQANYWGVYNSPIQHVRFMAGDVKLSTSGGEVINATDAAAIQSWFVSEGLCGCFDRGPWVYFKNQVISGNNDPHKDDDKINVTVASPGTSYQLYAMAAGDFNMSFVPNGAKSGGESLQLTYGKTFSEPANTEFDLPVYLLSHASLTAASIILNFPADLVEIKDVKMAGFNGQLDWLVKGNTIRIGYNTQDPLNISDDGVLLTLKLKTTAAFTEGRSIRFMLVSDPLNELADDHLNVIPEAVINMDVVEYGPTGIQVLSGNNDLVLTNHPNPFTDYTIFTYTLPFEGNVKIRIHNILGIEITTLVNEIQTRGDHKLKFDTHMLPTGVYTATLELNGNDDRALKTIKLVLNR